MNPSLDSECGEAMLIFSGWPDDALKAIVMDTPHSQPHWKWLVALSPSVTGGGSRGTMETDKHFTAWAKLKMISDIGSSLISTKMLSIPWMFATPNPVGSV